MPDQPLHHEQSPLAERAVVLLHLVVGRHGLVEEASRVIAAAVWSRPIGCRTSFVGLEP